MRQVDGWRPSAHPGVVDQNIDPVKVEQELFEHLLDCSSFSTSKVAASLRCPAFLISSVIQARAMLNEARTLDGRGDHNARLDTVTLAERRLGSP